MVSDQVNEQGITVTVTVGSALVVKVSAAAGDSRGPGMISAGENTRGPDGFLWYCAKTKPKHEHIAAANLRRNVGLQVFNPRLKSEKTTVQGVIKQVCEPVFPGYIFVQCALQEHLDEVRHTSGISALVNFGGEIPAVPTPVIAELMECFGWEETLEFHADPAPGDGVTMAGGAFLGMQAVVLRSWPAKRRVQVLLEILGRPTAVEVDRKAVTLHRQSIADFLPILAAASL